MNIVIIKIREFLNIYCKKFLINIITTNRFCSQTIKQKAIHTYQYIYIYIHKLGRIMDQVNS